MTTPRPVPPLLREQLDQGLLDPETAADVRARLAAGAPDPLAGLPDDATVFADDPPAQVAREVRRRIAEAGWAETRARRPRLWLIGATLAAAAALVVVLPSAVTPSDPDGIVLKGPAAVLDVYRLTAAGAPERVGDGVLARQGDRLQLTFRAPRARHLLVFSVDGRGVVTEHLRHDSELPLTEAVALDTSFVLDDAPDFEAFHLVASDARFDADAILADAERRGAVRVAPPVPVGVTVVTQVVAKEAR
ncbi:MAG: hypothetical protein H6732_06115 [Alphaproteobacteria bacterium]|nr:hypothetical protein [Alphaproteobacteria bacterium]